eukprot:GHRQ01010462.1.p1 GENE.GHRQ01010462.1~~GHRQ01010462.1.p1  ORF type:complete len:147 (+),score=3.06 GHRQ01010462.1:350-790(+)
MARETSTLYSVLGVSLVAPACEIRAAYRRLARVSGGLSPARVCRLALGPGFSCCVVLLLQQWHPDRHRGDELAKRRFQQIQEAYEVLIDSRTRETYDLKLVHLLDVEDYLARFKELILTASGLDMQPARTQHLTSLDHRQLLLTAA